MERAVSISIGSILLAAALCADAAPPRYTAIRIDTLGGTHNYGHAINAAGHVVGRTRKPGETARTDGHAYLFNGSATLALGPISWEGSAAADINDRGDIVGGFSSATGSGGFVVSNGVVSELRSVAGAPLFPTSINASGAIAGQYSGDRSWRSFLLLDGVLTDLGSFGGPFIGAASVNASGQVVGFAQTPDRQNRAFLYTAGALVDLGTLGGPTSEARGINARGDVVGRADTNSPDRSRAFLYTAGRMVDLGTLGSGSSAAAINDAGQIVGEFGDPAAFPATAGSLAFLYSEGVMHDLNTLVGSGLGGRTLTYGMDININGQIIAQSCSLPLLACETFRLDPTSPPGKARAVEYHHATFDHYFLTTIDDEIAKLDSGVFAGWTRTGGGFDVDIDPQTGTSPVCRFFSASFAPKSSHFYTSVSSECDAVKRGAVWLFEGVVFHVVQPDANGDCPSGRIAVFRLYNNGMSGAPNHRYTTSSILRLELIAKGWTPEGYGPLGVGMCA